MRRLRSAIVLGASLAASLVAATTASSPARAGEDPLRPLQGALDRQDQLTQQARFDEMLREAEDRARDGTPESLYLLGRALGNTALARAEEAKRREREDRAEAERLFREFESLLDRSRDAFERSREAGVLVYAPALLGLARCARSRGDLDGSIEQLRQALALDPDFKAATLDLAQVCFEKGLFADGEFQLYRYLEKHPEDGDTRLLLGVLKTRRKRFGEAELEFRMVLRQDAANAAARKLLAANLMYQEKYEEAAQHCEGCRKQNPKDDEPYRMLVSIYRHLGKHEEARKVLDDMRREFPGKEPGIWAERLVEEIEKDPAAFDAPSARSAEALIHRLDASDPDVVRQALADMRSFEWPALPAAVYRLLGKEASREDVRAQAVALVRAQRDPRTLTILEILLYHPRERDPSAAVRREAARAVASLPSAAALPVLWRALEEDDAEIREAAVRGIAEITGRWFRDELDVPTPPEAWPDELARYRKWWREERSASLHRRDAMDAMRKVFEPISRGRTRIAEYALDALDDPNPQTWRAGYDLFRSMTRHDFGATTGDVSEEERRRVAREARGWIAANADREEGQ